jgi:hypothetical protein
MHRVGSEHEVVGLWIGGPENELRIRLGAEFDFAIRRLEDREFAGVYTLRESHASGAHDRAGRMVDGRW